MLFTDVFIYFSFLQKHKLHHSCYPNKNTLGSFNFVCYMFEILDNNTLEVKCPMAPTFLNDFQAHQSSK